MKVPSKRLVKRQLFMLNQAINLSLSTKLNAMCNEEERKLSRQAYLSLCTLYNSLHRYLVMQNDLTTTARQ